MEARSNAMHHAFHLKKSQGVTKNCLFVDVQPNASVSESFGDIKQETGTAAELENVTAPAAIKGKILRAFDVAYTPILGVAKEMHLLYSAVIFPPDLSPRRLHFD